MNNGWRNYFTKQEKMLWGCSVLAIVLSFLFFDRGSYTTLIASLIGVTSLIFVAKGNPAGQGLMILFSVFYGWISFTFAYYGEMVTYLGMTAPMAIVALVSWLRHPYEGNKAEVKVDQIGRKESVGIVFMTAAVTVVFYFILGYFHTANLLPSTVSVATSFLAAYLTFRRSPFYALGYAVNDIVLVILWILAAWEDPSYSSVVVCFLAFLANDIYGFISWRRMEQRQMKQFA